MAYAYLTFFAGLFITWILDKLVHLALQKHDQRQALKHAAANGSSTAPGGSANPLRVEAALVARKSADTHLGSMEAGNVITEKATGKDVDDSSSESSEVELSYMLRRMSECGA